MKKEKVKSYSEHYTWFKKFKIYSPQEILAAGGPEEFGKLTGFDPEKLKNLPGESITDEELIAALEDLQRK